MGNEELIHIQWCGPLTMEKVGDLGGDTDYGVYQVYGKHPVYGSKALLYIGKARDQTFSDRLSQQEWKDWYFEEGKIEIHVGRLSGLATPSDEVWAAQIDKVEALLILACKPARNASMIRGISEDRDKSLQQVHVLNWGDYAALPPEVPGSRWTSVKDLGPTYGPYVYRGDKMNRGTSRL